MISLKELLDSSFRLLGIKNASASQYQDALVALNAMVESFSVDRSLYRTMSKAEIGLIANESEYNMPTGILSLEGVSVLHSNSNIPLVELKSIAYNELPTKNTVTSDIPYYYYENADKLHVYPVPSINAPMYLYIRSELSLSSNLVDMLDVPDTWIRPLRYNLAVMIAPEYGINTLDSVRRIAASSKAILEATYSNSEVLESGSGVAIHLVTLLNIRLLRFILLRLFQKI